MKRKFTYLLTALALLAFLSPTTAWGGVKLADTQRITQKTAHETMLAAPDGGEMTREDVVAYTLTPASGSNNSYASNCDIEINGITWNLTGNSTTNPWRIGGKSITNTDRPLYSKTAIADNITKIEVTHGAASSITINSWTVIVASDADFTNVVSTLTPTFEANATTTINRPDGKDWSNCYYKFVYNVTVSVNSNKFLEFSEAKFYKEVSGGQPTTYTVTYNGNGNDSGTVPTDNTQYTSGQSVTVLGNTGDLAKTDYTWAGWNTAADGSGTDYAAGATFNISANTTLYAKWTANGGSNPGLDVDFESALTTYTDWQFTNIVKANSDITAHGGTYFGSNANSNGNGTTTASIQTATAIVNPQSLTCYVSKRSNNTTSSTWYIQVSSDGTTWTNVSSQSATSMEKGEWVAFTANLTSYSNVYVRIYYSGSSALRAIDDIALTTMPTTPTIVFSPTSISLGNVVVGEPISQTFTVAQANLTADIALSALVGSLNPSTILQGAAATQVTWTYTPSAAGAINATVTATSGTLNETLAITGTAKAAHNITINQMTNGSVTASANSAVEGETITLTVTPDAGYTLDDLTVTNTTTSQTVTVTNNTFEMPDAPVTVSATFSAIQAMTVAEALAATAPQSGVYVHGIISQIDEVSTQYHNATYCISDDGSTTNQMIVYRGKYLNNTDFTSTDQIGIGDEVIVTGNLSEYQGVNQLAQGNYIVSLVQVQPFTFTLGNHSNIAEYFLFIGDNPITLDANDQAQIPAGATVYVSATAEECRILNGLTVTYDNNQTATVTEIEPNVYYSFVMPSGDATLNFVTTQAQQYELTVGTSSHVTLEILAGEVSTEIESGDDVCEGLNVTIIATAEQGYVLQSVNVVDENDDPVTLNNEGNGVYWFEMPSSDITVTAMAAPRTLNTYTLASSIVPGQTYLITNGSDEAMGEQRQNNRGAATVDGNAGVIIVGSDNTDVYEFIIDEVSTGTREGETLYTIQDVRSQKYLYAASSSSNNLKEQATLDDNGKWTISIADGVATIVAQGTNTRNTMRYNPNNGNPIFSCYASTSTTGSLPVLYVKNNATQTATYTKTIQSYSGDGGYYLIASPVVGVIPTASNGFLTNAYDFYYFDQSKEDEWRNFEANSYDLISGKGYLYANSGNNGQATTLTFTGTPYTGNGQITLSKVDGVDWEGWNLIGNPYATGMVLKDANNGNKAFYTLNPAGSDLMGGTPGDEIAAMEGVFVEATTDGEVVSFVEETGGGGGGGGGFDFISLNVSRNRGASAGSATIDRAIIGIGDGPMLHKFQLNPSNTKIYITEANQDYAIVRSANEAELPVSFRASENGTYTFSVEVNNVEMNYLHLIDNMTGADVDLLATPSYTFEAKTSDYASRFRLVFNANNTDEDGASTGSATFAYFNGSNWTVSNMGEATLQVVDVMGRVISSEQINGNAEVSINQPAGVYMLRLVSGDSVKVQKVVVR